MTTGSPTPDSICDGIGRRMLLMGVSAGMDNEGLLLVVKPLAMFSKCNIGLCLRTINIDLKINNK